MDLIKFKTFETVARLKSFSRAAETLYFSQPAISAQIKDLEYEYGEKLFNREGRKIEITKAGLVLLSYVELMLKTFEESKYAVNFVKDEKKGVVQLGVSTFPGTHYLPSMIAEFKKHHPETTFYLDVQNAKKIRDMVLKKELEFGIVGSIETLASNSSLNEETLFEDEVVLAVNNRHPLASKEYVEIKDLKKITLISGFKNTVSRQVTRKLFFKHGITRKITYEIENKGMTKAMIQNGLGCAFFARSEVQLEAEAGWMTLLKIKGETLTRKIILVSHKEHELSPTGKLFVDFIKDNN